MGKVYLGDKFISDVYTHIKEIPVEKYVDVLKKPVSRYMVDKDGAAKPIEFDFTGGFNEITSISDYGLYQAFYGCTGITGSIDFPKLTSVGNRGLVDAFYGCTGITSVSFPNLTSIGDVGLYFAFAGCIGIKGSIDFPNLTSIGDSGLDYAFSGCIGISELHFRADTQSVIEALSGYGNKFGATNSNIYFDL